MKRIKLTEWQINVLHEAVWQYNVIRDVDKQALLDLLHNANDVIITVESMPMLKRKQPAA